MMIGVSILSMNINRKITSEKGNVVICAVTRTVREIELCFAYAYNNRDIEAT